MIISIAQGKKIDILSPERQIIRGEIVNPIKTKRLVIKRESFIRKTLSIFKFVAAMAILPSIRKKKKSER